MAACWTWKKSNIMQEGAGTGAAQGGTHAAGKGCTVGSPTDVQGRRGQHHRIAECRVSWEGCTVGPPTDVHGRRGQHRQIADGRASWEGMYRWIANYLAGEEGREVL